MADENWDKVKEALKKAPTPEARKAAAEAMRRYLANHPAKKSRPTVVSLGLHKTYPSAIPLEKVPEELEKTPEFFELMGRIVREK